MPITELDSATAIDTMKANGAATWPKRGSPNRLSPIAKPRLQSRFELEGGESVFTIGSCFARNVERELAARGFVLPANDAIKDDPDLVAMGTGVLNNYGTPSIYNEIYWALERDYRDEECFYPVGSKWVDMHLLQKLRPTDLDTCRLRRRAITEAYREIPNSRVIVITLGLSEVWLDTKTGVYLNNPPRRGMLRDDPDRFKLHVLTFDEAMGFMRGAMELIAKHGRPDVRVMMTVSPVPLSATHRDMDVMEANAYSKAVLRVVAEHIRSEFDFVDYYPSFESVTLSERHVAWQDDEVHVTPDIVSVNIGRMVNAYTATTKLTLDELKDRVRSEKPAERWRLIEENSEHLSDREIVSAYVDSAIRTNRFAEAEKYLDLADDPLGLHHAAIAYRKDDFQACLDSLKPTDRPTVAWFRYKLRSYIGLGEIENAKKVLREWSARTPQSFDGHIYIAHGIDDFCEAAPYYEKAIEISGNAPKPNVEYAERLLREGKVAEAKRQIEGVVPDTSPLRDRIERIIAAI
ncbi:GSCFA domain-containing protein [uncultured Parasphingopyxis sp.]|uniref:GSCFA domain-containing protein n=1 Tax=uncultured Parasphingopyxis sp. TaxID=1547918 RepID=UPI00261E12C9|nr:GSCFA domain-containing protein [uncultured Parasphingopyxis sp.]